MSRLLLPFPPSVNTYWRNFNGRTILSAKGREYKKLAMIQAYEQECKPSRGRLEVSIIAYRPDKRRRDLDNLLKATLDACTGHCWDDDSQIDCLTIKWGNRLIKGGLVDVMVTELEEFPERTIHDLV